MSDYNTIDHEGIVASVNGGVARIVINSQSACASCHAKGACTSADQEEKVLEVPLGATMVAIGERVKVHVTQRAGLRAVAVGYIYPFFLLMLVLIALLAAGFSELEAGLASLAVLVPYYLAVFLFRNRIGRSFMFNIEKLNLNV